MKVSSLFPVLKEQVIGTLPFLFAATAGVLASMVVVVIGGADPLQGIFLILSGAFGTPYRIGETLVSASPLLVAGVGVAIAFRVGFWNIGSEGQIIIGSISAVWVGLSVVGLPGVLHIPLVLLTGFVMGGLWAMLPGVLKVKFDLNEVLTTVMMNYIAYWLSFYLIIYPLDDPATLFPQTYRILDSARLPKLIPGTRAHVGIVLFIILAIIFYFLIKRTSLGYEIRTMGKNPSAGLYAGMNIGKIILIAVMISGGLAGVAGAVQVCGLNYSAVPGMTEGYGFLAIAVALLGSLNPIGIIFSALFFGALQNGAGFMQRRLGISSTSLFVVTGVVAIFTLTVPLFQRLLYRVRNQKK